MTSPIDQHTAALRASYTPAMSAEQAISKMAFAVREIERMPRDGWSEQQIERLRALVSAADGAVVKMEGEKKWPKK